MMPPIEFLEPGESLHRVTGFTTHYVVLARRTSGIPVGAAGSQVGCRSWLQWGERKGSWLLSDEILLTEEDARLQLFAEIYRLFYLFPRPYPHRELFAVQSERKVVQITLSEDSSLFREAVWLFQAEDSQEKTRWNCWAWSQGIVTQVAPVADERIVSVERTQPNIMAAVQGRLFFE
jgi:hypothetical protein